MPKQNSILNRRLLSWLLAALLILGLIPTSSVSAAESPDYAASLSVLSPSIEEGEELDVTFAVTGGSYASVQATLSYDSEVFTYEGDAVPLDGGNLLVTETADGSLLLTRYGGEANGGSVARLTFRSEKIGNAEFSASDIYVSPSGSPEESQATNAPVVSVAVITPPANDVIEIFTNADMVGGSLSFDPVNPKPGDRVSVTATPAPGYRLLPESMVYEYADGEYAGLKFLPDTGVDGSVGRFRIPNESESDVYFTAYFASVDTTSESYTIIPEQPEHGQVRVYAPSAASYVNTPAKMSAGTRTSVSVIPKDGYYKISPSLTARTLVDGDGRIFVLSATTFYMPAADVTLRGEIVVNSDKYDIKVDPSVINGTIEIEPAEAAYGEPVTLTPVPDAGFMLTPGTVKYRSNFADHYVTPAGDGSYTFVAGHGAVVSAAFERVPKQSELWAGTGTELDPYVISDLEGFLDFRDFVDDEHSYSGVHFRLATDLDLTEAGANFRPIGTKNDENALGYYRIVPFNGVFDGNGHTINVYIHYPLYSEYLGQTGLFRQVDGTIKNLTITGSVGAYSPVAAFSGGGHGTYINCVNTAGIGSATRHSARSAGIAVSGDVFIDCENRGLIGGANGRSAGIAVSVYELAQNCVNYVNIGSEVSAGIAEEASGLVIDCDNYGNMTGGGAAGIVRELISGRIERCYNAGAISASIGTLSAGGIAANVTRGEIIDCYNTAPVVNKKIIKTPSNSLAVAAGGIVGKLGGGSIENCYNSGAVSASSVDTGAYAGSISGIGGAQVTSNSYYLAGTAARGFGNGADGAGTKPVSDAALRVLANSLGGSFKNQSDGYPVLTRQGADDGLRAVTSVADGLVTSTVTGTDLSRYAEGGVYAVELVLAVNDDVKAVTDVDVTLRAAPLAALKNASATLKLNTNLGYVEFDAAAISGLISASGGNDVLLSVRKTESSSIDAVRGEIEAGSAVFEIALSANGVAITDALSGKISAGLPGERPFDTPGGFEVWRISEDEEKSKVTAVFSGGLVNFDTDGPAYFSVAFVARDPNVPGENGSGDVNAAVWDGKSIDVSWFDPYASTYNISTPAELAGLAALVNGIYNDEIDTFAGDMSYVNANKEVNGEVYDPDTHFNASGTDIYHIGDYDFAGKTVYLDADIDMSGGNYMPIGGQYLMSYNDPATKISSSFNGTFDGRGHSVKIICDRWSTDYMDGSTVGLIGRLGAHDNDHVSRWATNPTVRNVAVYGSLNANRSVGGIVGKTGKTAGNFSTIENCANFAVISSTDAKGIGGIVGSAWNGGIIKNCYNAGTVVGGYPAGGIAGSNENSIEHCFNVGTVYSNYGDSFAMGIGSDNGGATYADKILNSHSLAGAAPGGGYYDSNNAAGNNVQSSETMKSESFIALLGDAFTPDLTPNINDGYPILSWQTYAPFDPGTPNDEVFTVSIVQPANGFVSANIPSGKSGAAVVLSVSPSQGYILDHYTVNGVAIRDAVFLLTEDATVTAVMRERSGDYPPGWSKQRPSFGIYITNEDGKTGTLIGNWNYDDDKETYVDAGGIEADFITTFDEPLVYSGLDRMPAARLGVVKKGILAEDLIDYYNANNGAYPDVTDENYADFTMLASTNSQSSEDPYTSNDPRYPGKWPLYSVFDDFTGTERYYYPDFLKGANTGEQLKTKQLGEGVITESVIAVTSYNDRVANISDDAIGRNGTIDDDAELAAAVAYLLSKADNERALRNFDGMAPLDESGVYGADNPRLPLGADDSYWIGSVWITPPGAGGGTPDPADRVYTVDAPYFTGGVLTPSPAEAKAGERVTVTVYTQSRYRLVPGSLKYDGRDIDADSSGVYGFTMPDWDVTLSADFIETEMSVTPPDPDDELFKDGIKGSGDISKLIWDGKSIDISWFDPNADTYHIKTPAQLAGLAALVNGLYNREIDTVAGKASYIHVNTGLGDDDGPQGNNKSTPTYHYGDYNFAGKTVYLDNDVDMGGANYMPIGGQYLMRPGDSTTRVDSSFNGVFDGRGHSVTIKAERRVYTGNYGDGSSVGLIGRLGVHDNDPTSLRAEGLAVKNVAVYGSVSGNRSVGGVVGKIGKTADSYAVIENCANFASISSSDAKGVGGIVGAAWNGGTIKNCYNAGTVNGTHPNPAGGVAGSVEILIENSYSYGRVTAPSGYAMGLGTRNLSAPTPSNSYYLEGSASGGGWYTGGTADNSGVRTSEFMKSDEFVKLLGSAFLKDTNGINGGYPVLRWQGGTAVSSPSVSPEDGSKPAVSVPSTTTVKDGEAVTIVDVPDSDNPIGGGEASRLVVNVDTGGESVSKITAEMPAEFVKQASESKSDIEIRSDVANVLLPEKAVAELAAGGKDVSVKAEKDEAANTYIFTVESDGKALETVDGGIRAAIPAKDAGAGAVAVLVHSDGTYEIIKKSVIIEDDLLVPLSGSATIRIEDRAKAFTDVADGAWYADAVRFVTGRELFNGTSETEFSPNAPMTRAMLVTVLYRLENEPETGLAAFSDVGADRYYARAVAWASENGIVEGIGDGFFAPGAEITREQLAAILYRYAGAQGLDISVAGDVSSFMDAKDVSAWASDALAWAVGSGIITGRSNPVGVELAPKDTATRAEVAAMIMRLIERIVES
jgi:hypothetical protein